MACHRSLAQPHDANLSLMLRTYIATGMFFMLLPGTFVGVVTLLRISAAHAAGSVDAGWVQAHGHAQIFGWLGTFILGVGFYTIPRMRLSAYRPCAAWVTWVLWTAGVALRWAGVRVGSALELLAFLLFAATVYLPKAQTRDRTWRTSVLMIDGAALGLFATLLLNAVESFRVAVFPPAFNARFLATATWGFVVPFMFGFATRWIPPLLGLRASRTGWFLPALGGLYAGLALTWSGRPVLASSVLLAAAALFCGALRIFEPARREAKLRGVHPTVGIFLRLAFGWLLAAAGLGIAAAAAADPGGLAGASRHALTVGFMLLLVFCVAPRVLPAFFGVPRLWSVNAMFTSLLLANIGCALRVGAQILAYGHIAGAAWGVLPVSAVTEMSAVLLFTVNLGMTMMLPKVEIPLVATT